MKHIGFTGTQVGMSGVQQVMLDEMLARNLLTSDPITFHHGDCIGADAEAHDIAANYEHAIVIHPPINESKRAFMHTGADVTIVEARDYIARNHDIVDACELLIAAPKDENTEELRSGTWATIRYARKCGKRVIILPR